jgi:hypothetical protein
MSTTRKPLKNPTLRLSEEVAAARLRRAGVTLGADLHLPRPPKPLKGNGFRASLVKRLAGG